MLSADFEAWVAGDETEQTNKILSNSIKYADSKIKKPLFI